MMNRADLTMMLTTGSFEQGLKHPCQLLLQAVASALHPAHVLPATFESWELGMSKAASELVAIRF